MNNHTDAIRGTGCIVNENRMSVKYEWIRYACKRLGILCRASFRTKQTDAENAKRLTFIQVSTTAIWRPTFRERITVPTNRMNSVRNQFQPRKGVI